MSLHILRSNRVQHEIVAAVICFDNIYIKSINHKKSDFTVGLFTFEQVNNQKNEKIIL